MLGCENMKQRIISAIIMIIIVVPILIMGGLPFKIFSIVLATLGMYEFMKVREAEKKFPIYMKLLAYIFIF